MEKPENSQKIAYYKINTPALKGRAFEIDKIIFGKNKYGMWAAVVTKTNDNKGNTVALTAAGEHQAIKLIGIQTICRNKPARLIIEDVKETTHKNTYTADIKIEMENI